MTSYDKIKKIQSSMFISKDFNPSSTIIINHPNKQDVSLGFIWRKRNFRLSIDPKGYVLLVITIGGKRSRYEPLYEGYRKSFTITDIRSKLNAKIKDGSYRYWR